MVIYPGLENEVAFHWKFNEYSYYNSLADTAGGQGKQHIGIQYADTTVDINYDAKMVEFNDLVSAVGGALGLFLGFSMIDTFLYFFNVIINLKK